ncbi:MAG: hypothetical protein EBY58_02025 [Rhodobacteraceae bacterium]|nr:hypothetical protein [Paracoccaceae bacterium]
MLLNPYYFRSLRHISHAPHKFSRRVSTKKTGVQRESSHANQMLVGAYSCRPTDFQGRSINQLNYGMKS